MNSSQLFPDVNSAICDVLLDSNWSWISGIKYKIDINSINKNHTANLKLNTRANLNWIPNRPLKSDFRAHLQNLLNIKRI